MATRDGPAQRGDRVDRQRSGPEVTTPQPAPDVTDTSRTILPGCPVGCGEWHECGIGEPINTNVDYSLSPIFVGNPPQLSDLRSTAVAA